MNADIDRLKAQINDLQVQLRSERSISRNLSVLCDLLRQEVAEAHRQAEINRVQAEKALQVRDAVQKQIAEQEKREPTLVRSMVK